MVLPTDFEGEGQTPLECACRVCIRFGFAGIDRCLGQSCLERRNFIGVGVSFRCFPSTVCAASTTVRILPSIVLLLSTALSLEPSGWIPFPIPAGCSGNALAFSAA